MRVGGNRPTPGGWGQQAPVGPWAPVGGLTGRAEGAYTRLGPRGHTTTRSRRVPEAAQPASEDDSTRGARTQSPRRLARRRHERGPPRPLTVRAHTGRAPPASGTDPAARWQMLYLSQAIGRPVRDRNDEPIGKVADLIVAVGDRYPPVTGLVVETDRRRIFLPWTSVEYLDATGAQAGHPDDRHRQVPPARRTRSSCARTCMDKQIVDIDGRKVVRVNDLRLDEIEGKLHLVAVDVGRGRPAPPARASRARFRTIARNLRVPVPERYIDWEDVDPVETSIASIKLRVPHARPGRAPPRRPRHDHRPARPEATGRASSPRSTTRRWPMPSRRWSPTPRSRSSRTWPPSAPPTSSRR